MIKVLIALLILGTYSPSFANDHQTEQLDGPTPDFSTITIPEYGLAVPHTGLVDIALIYDEDISNGEKDSVANFLKEFVLTYSPQFIRAHEKYFSEKNANPAFISAFKAAKDWYVQILWKKPDAIRTIAQNEENQLLGFMLNYRAELVESRHETYQYYFDNSPRPENLADHEYIFNFVFDRAQLNYRPAMLELATAYLNGNKLSQSYAKSYFWYLNAQWEGADVESKLSELKAKLAPSQVLEINQMFKNDKYPNLVEENEKQNSTLDIERRRVPPYLDEK